MADFKIVRTNWEKDKSLLTEIRKQVFIIEQNVPAEIELDELDQQAVHFLVYKQNQEAIGTARFLTIDNNRGKIGRMSVLKQYRNQGCGLALLNACLKWAKKQKIAEVILHAQNQAIPFYQKSGFRVRGNEFMDAGIPHHEMYLRTF